MGRLDAVVADFLQDLLQISDGLTSLSLQIFDIVILMLLKQGKNDLLHFLFVVSHLLALDLLLPLILEAALMDGHGFECGGHVFVQLLQHSPRLSSLGQRVLLDAVVERIGDGTTLGPLDHLPLHGDLVPLRCGGAGEHAQLLSLNVGHLELVLLTGNILKQVH